MITDNIYKSKNQLILFSKVKLAVCYFYSIFNFFQCRSLLNVKTKTRLLFFTFSFLLLRSYSQTYPVQINTQLVPPYSGYLPDYGDPTAQNLKVFLQFNDFTTPQYNLRLKFEIKGNGFSLITKTIFNPPPITLQPGQPILLSGTDIAPYLSSNNLDFIGINQNQYEQRMALPEGYYSICITAYDYYSGSPVQVSNEACAQGWFTLSNPPLLNLPLCNSVVNPLQPQNLFFNWTPVNLGSPNSAFNTSYLFELWEMRPDSTVNPNQLVQNTQPVFSQITAFNSLNYGITETPLNLYYKYAWRVKAIDGSGKDWFINNGYSQVCTFYYGSIANTLGNALNLNLQAEAVDYVSGTATWTLQNFYNSYQLDVREAGTNEWTTYTTTLNNVPLTNLQPGKTYESRVKGFGNAVNGDFSNVASFTTPVPPVINLQTEALDYTTGRAFWTLQNIYNNYQLEIRKKNTPNWFQYTTTSNSQILDNLEPNKTYECRIKGFGTNFNSDYGNTAEFTTPPPPSYNCNQAAPIYSNNTTPLPYNKAVTGMTLKSGQFDIVIKFISPGTMGAGYYTGGGYAMMFGTLPIPVTFTNVFIDENKRQQQGVIHAVTKGMKNWMQQFDIEDAEDNATYVNGTLDTVYINNGQYCYTTLENQTPICTPFDPEKLPLVIRDGEGNQYVINAGPPPTVTGPSSYLNLSNDNLAATNTLMVQFAKAPNQNFGFDSKEYPAFTEEYECIKLSNGKNYFVPNKSVGNGVNQTDRVIATYTINNFNPAQLSFKTKGGASLTKTSINNNTAFEVTNIPPSADCIYAWYNNQKIGKLNIISLNKISKKVVLVPVNGASTTGLTQQGLNDIYKQANTTFTLTTAPNFTFDLGNDGLEAADATLFKKYSTEMRALRDAYKTQESLYDQNAYYIFVVPNFSNPQQQGYMVRGRAVGFIKTGASVTDVAHELAHGAFKLEHTFDAIAKGTSNNLMDYNNGTHLAKSQWLNIQDPTGQLSWFDEEEDASSVVFPCVNNNIPQALLNLANRCKDKVTADNSFDTDFKNYISNSNGLANLIYLCPKQRMDMIKCLVNGDIVDDDDENSIVKLFSSAPNSQIDEILLELKKTTSFSGPKPLWMEIIDEFDELENIQKLNETFARYSENKSSNYIKAPIENKIVLYGETETRIGQSPEEYLQMSVLTLTLQNQILITNKYVHVYPLGIGPNNSATENKFTELVVDPFDDICVTLLHSSSIASKNNLQNLGFSLTNNKYVVMPACFWHYIGTNDTRKLFINGYVEVFAKTLSGFGLGQYQYFNGFLRYALVAADAVYVANQVISSPATQAAINQADPSGKFNYYWTWVNRVSGGIYLTAFGKTIIENLKSSFLASKTSLQNQLPPADFKKIEDAIKKIDDAFLVSSGVFTKYDKINTWLNGIANTTLKTNIQNIIKNWSDDVLTSLNSKIDLFPGLQAEFLANNQLLHYFNRLETTWWFKYPLGGLAKRTNSPLPNSFKQMVGEIEVTSLGQKLQLKTVSLDEATAPYIGKLFDEIVEVKVVNAWKNNNFSDLPNSVASQLQALKNQGYELAVEAKLTINGKNPVPDYLFIKKEIDQINNLITYDLNNVKYIDCKYLWDSPFSANQAEVVNGVTNSGVANTVAPFGIKNVNDVQIAVPNAAVKIKTVQKLTVSQQMEMVIQ
jgi:hypothetical protein